MAPKPPDNLTEAQQRAWSEAFEVLQAAGRAERVNLAQLEVYARAVVRMRDAEAHVTEHGTIVPAPRTGSPIRNPNLGIANEASATVARLSSLLGIEGAPTLPAKPLALSEYAKRRGVSHEAVRKAVAAGRLKECLVTVRGKAKIADPDLADREWVAAAAPPPPPPKRRKRKRAAAPQQMDGSTESLLLDARATVARGMQALDACIQRVASDLAQEGDDGDDRPYNDKAASHLAWITKHAAQILGEIRKLEVHDRHMFDRMSDEEKDELVAAYIAELGPERRAVFRHLLDRLDSEEHLLS